MYLIRVGGGVLFLIGALIMAWNIYKTISSVEEATIRMTGSAIT